MKVFLENTKLYVKNDDNLIYETQSINSYDDHDWLEIDLVLVAGWNYINSDTNDIQGYVKADKFDCEKQNETVVHYFFNEGMKECLISNGYEIIENLPPIY